MNRQLWASMQATVWREHPWTTMKVNVCIREQQAEHLRTTMSAPANNNEVNMNKDKNIDEQLERELCTLFWPMHATGNSNLRKHLEHKLKHRRTTTSASVNWPQCKPPCTTMLTYVNSIGKQQQNWWTTKKATTVNDNVSFKMNNVNILDQVGSQLWASMQRKRKLLWKKCKRQCRLLWTTSKTS